MSFLIDTWYLFLAAAVSGGLLLWPMLTSGATGGGVTAAEAVQLINRERAVLVDVRDASEFAAGHMVGAKNVPLEKLPTATGELPKNKSVPVVVVCGTGNRASKGVGILKKLGYENARPMVGGLKAWRVANLPVEKSA